MMKRTPSQEEARRKSQSEMDKQRNAAAETERKRVLDEAAKTAVETERKRLLDVAAQKKLDDAAYEVSPAGVAAKKASDAVALASSPAGIKKAEEDAQIEAQKVFNQDPSLARLKTGFAELKGGYALAIAGVMIGSANTRYTSEKILSGTAKMYAGVNVKIDGGGATFDPERWVYSLNQDSTKNIVNKQRLTDVTSDEDKIRATDMFNEIVTLAGTETLKIDGPTLGFKEIKGKILTGTYALGERFQLIFRYDRTVPTGTVSADDDINAVINGTGYIRYGNKDTDVKQFVVIKNQLQLEEVDKLPVKNLIERLIKGILKIAPPDEEEDVEEEDVDEEGLPIIPVDGGKLSRKKRQMSYKKGGRKNYVSRKRNKKGGAKIRRSQKAGKHMR